MALYADENFPLRVVEELRRLGHDIITAFEDGKANQAITDRQLLERAIEIGRAVLTLNRLDFKRYILNCQNTPELSFVRKIPIALPRRNGLTTQSRQWASYPDS